MESPTIVPTTCTLVLTDLVGSTRLVERLGDLRAAEIGAEHDRLARELIARQGGREIDKTDGFLLLFDRPVDGVRHVIAYHQLLRDLSSARGVELAARAAIHHGDVILRENPPGDIARGAKPLEVEGLAKPLAARVMSLAVAGQTLMTRGGFDLARRAAVGHDAFDEQIRWLAHGPYLLQGMEEPVEVFEVGRCGTAPLSPPPSTEKARRILRPGEEDLLGWRPAPGGTIPGRESWVLGDKLGEGGFGEVWLARHHKTREPRVFKFCFDPDRLKGLKREVTVFRLLKETLGDREDIARVIDWSFDAPPFFIEGDYTAGGNLADWAGSQGGLETLPLDRRLALVAEVATALSAAHSVGVLHKDIKPSNVLVHTGRDGLPHARLTDFGIGIITDKERLALAGVTATGLTEASLAGNDSSRTGTRLYMAPELLEGKPASIQADVFALGVMLWQMVVGDLHRALSSDWREEVEDELLLEDIASCVAGDPARRLDSAADLAERLASLDERRAERERERREREEAEAARTAMERNRRRRRVATGVAVIATVFLVCVSFLYLRAEAARKEAESLQEIAIEKQAAAIAARQLAEARAVEISSLKEDIERELYRASINLAQQQMEEGDLKNARESLLRAPTEYRHWEWGYLMGETYNALMEFPGHSTTVTSVDWSPSGHLIASASVDGTIHIWNFWTGEALASFEENHAGVHKIRWSADGQLLAAALSDGRVVFRHADDGRIASTLAGHEGGVVGLCQSSDGSQWITLDASGNIRVFDTVSWNSTKTIRTDEAPCYSMTISPDGRLAAIGGGLDSLHLVDLETGIIIQSISLRFECFDAVFLPDSSGLYVTTNGGGNSFISLGGRALPTIDKTFNTPSIAVPGWGGALALSRKTDQLVVTSRSSSDSGIYFFAIQQEDFLRPKIVKNIHESGVDVNTVDLSSDERFLAIGRSDGVVKVYSMQDDSFGKADRFAPELQYPPSHLAGWLNTDNELFLSRVVSSAKNDSGQATGVVVDAGLGMEVLALDVPWFSRRYATTRGGRAAVFVGRGGVSEVSLSSGKQLLQFPIPDDCDHPVSLDVCHGETILATALSSYPVSVDPRVDLWSLETGRHLQRINVEQRPCGVCYHPLDNTLIIATENGTILRVAEDTMGVLWRTETNSGRVFDLKANHAHNRVLAAHNIGTCSILDADSGEIIAVLRGHGASVASVEVSPDNRRIATASLDGRVGIWDFVSGEAILFLEPFSGSRVWNAVWSRDQHSLFMTSSGTSITRKVFESVPWSTNDNLDSLVRVWQSDRLQNSELHMNIFSRLPTEYWRLNRLAAQWDPVEETNQANLVAEVLGPRSNWLSSLPSNLAQDANEWSDFPLLWSTLLKELTEKRFLDGRTREEMETLLRRRLTGVGEGPPP